MTRIDDDKFDGASLKKLALLNLVDDSLAALARKGNLGYAYELYNPLEAFRAVHHPTFYPEDRDLVPEKPWLRVHTLVTLRRHLRGLGHLVDLPLCLVQIWWIARRHRVAAVRGRGPLFGSALGILVARLRRIPCVVSIGGDHRLARGLLRSYPVFGSRRLTEWLEAWVLRHADEVWCPSEFARRYALELGVRLERAIRMPWRLRSDVFSAKAGPPDALRAAGVDLASPIVLFVGRLERDKGPDMVLRAVAKAAVARPDIQAVFVGDGRQREKLAREAAALGIEPRVRWLGFRSTEVVKSCLAAASVVCIPMSGFVVFEAAAFAKPMVVCDVEWHAEFTRSGETGMLVPEGDDGRMAAAILELLADPARARRMGEAAKDLLLKAYAPDKIAVEEVARWVSLIERFGVRGRQGADPAGCPGI